MQLSYANAERKAGGYCFNAVLIFMHGLILNRFRSKEASEDTLHSFILISNPLRGFHDFIACVD